MQPSVQHGLLLALVARAVWRLVGVHTEELCERCSARTSAVSHVYVNGVGVGSTCKMIRFKSEPRRPRGLAVATSG